jgi:hypothetical protein
MSCTGTVERRITQPGSFSTWSTQTLSDVNTLSAATGGVLTPDQLTQLQRLETDLFDTVNCLRLKQQALRSAPTNVATMQEQIVALQNEISTKQDQYDVAKERANSIQNPEQKTSDYEGWFPIGRSMRSTSLFILIGFSIFFILFFFGLLMSFLGFQIQLSWALPRIQMSGPPTPWMTLILSWINPLTLAALTALIITSGFLIWMGTK